MVPSGAPHERVDSTPCLLAEILDSDWLSIGHVTTILSCHWPIILGPVSAGSQRQIPSQYPEILKSSSPVGLQNGLQRDQIGLQNRLREDQIGLQNRLREDPKTCLLETFTHIGDKQSHLDNISRDFNHVNDIRCMGDTFARCDSTPDRSVSQAVDDSSANRRAW